MDNQQPEKLFKNGRYCKGCGKLLYESYQREYCSTCEAQRIFDDVRDYIRSGEVNEYDVSKKFDIPVGMVQQWIKEGRIEYKEKDAPTLTEMFCQRCGARVTFGTLCQKCLKEMNDQRKGYTPVHKPHDVDNKIRFLDTGEKEAK